MEDQRKEDATLHPKDSYKDPHLPNKGPRSYTTKLNKRIENIAIQQNILTLTNDIQIALAAY